MTQKIDVSITPQSYLPEIRASENDNTLRVITVTVLDDEGTPYEPDEGVTATFAGTKPSGLGFTLPCEIGESGRVSFTLPSTATNEVGRFPAEIRFMNGTARIGTCNLMMRIEPNPHPDDVTDGDREPLIDEITALLEEITEQADKVNEAMDAWQNMTVEATTLPAGSDATASYSEGTLTLGIPAGVQGETGPQGPQGEVGPQGQKGDKGDTGDVSIAMLQKVMVEETATGTIASFSDGSDVLPMKSLKVTLSPIQDTSGGSPSPTNVCPISGYDEVSAVVSPTTTASDGQTYTASLPETVYGGTMDLVSGEVVIDRVSVDLTQGMSGGTIGGNYLYYTQVADAKTVSNSQIANIISEGYVPIRYNGVATNVGTIAIRDNHYLYVNTGSQDTLPTGKAVYELATPQTIQLTPQEIRTLVGYNNVWGSGDEVDAIYFADTKLYIEKMLS